MAITRGGCRPPRTVLSRIPPPPTYCPICSKIHDDSLELCISNTVWPIRTASVHVPLVVLEDAVTEVVDFDLVVEVEEP